MGKPKRTYAKENPLEEPMVIKNLDYWPTIKALLEHFPLKEIDKLHLSKNLCLVTTVNRSVFTFLHATELGSITVTELPELNGKNVISVQSGRAHFLLECDNGEFWLFGDTTNGQIESISNLKYNNFHFYRMKPSIIGLLRKAASPSRGLPFALQSNLNLGPIIYSINNICNEYGKYIVVKPRLVNKQFNLTSNDFIRVGGDMTVVYQRIISVKDFNDIQEKLCVWGFMMGVTNIYMSGVNLLSEHKQPLDIVDVAVTNHMIVALTRTGHLYRWTATLFMFQPLASESLLPESVTPLNRTQFALTAILKSFTKKFVNDIMHSRPPLSSLVTYLSQDEAFINKKFEKSTVPSVNDRREVLDKFLVQLTKLVDKKKPRFQTEVKHKLHLSLIQLIAEMAGCVKEQLALPDINKDDANSISNYFAKVGFFANRNYATLFNEERHRYNNSQPHYFQTLSGGKLCLPQGELIESNVPIKSISSFAHQMVLVTNKEGGVHCITHHQAHLITVTNQPGSRVWSATDQMALLVGGDGQCQLIDSDQFLTLYPLPGIYVDNDQKSEYSLLDKFIRFSHNGLDGTLGRMVSLAMPHQSYVSSFNNPVTADLVYQVSPLETPCDKRKPIYRSIYISSKIFDGVLQKDMCHLFAYEIVHRESNNMFTDDYSWYPVMHDFLRYFYPTQEVFSFQHEASLKIFKPMPDTLITLFVFATHKQEAALANLAGLFIGSEWIGKSKEEICELLIPNVVTMRRLRLPPRNIKRHRMVQLRDLQLRSRILQQTIERGVHALAMAERQQRSPTKAMQDIFSAFTPEVKPKQVEEVYSFNDKEEREIEELMALDLVSLKRKCEELDNELIQQKKQKILNCEHEILSIEIARNLKDIWEHLAKSWWKELPVPKTSKKVPKSDEKQKEKYLRQVNPNLLGSM